MLNLWRPKSGTVKIQVPSLISWQDDCKRLIQKTVSKMAQTVRPRAALQLDLETAYLAGCQIVVNSLVKGWTLACPSGCASDSPKADIYVDINRGPCPPAVRQQLVIAITIQLIARFARPAAPLIYIIPVTLIQVPLTMMNYVLQKKSAMR